MSFYLSSVRDDATPVTIHSTPSVLFEYIDTHEVDLPVQPNYIQVGHAPIRHPHSQRHIGNTHLCPPSTLDCIDIPHTAIVSPQTDDHDTERDRVIHSIRTMIQHLHTRH